ncbi:uncharacterized protein LOC129776015 [Toxorhynchites rutilus septentrionalis]|uniref:uncharacterized protein LOC129776015 n=1 Tax=Toxorhynchites rutilus septentrionalis TaxID=329112 RepID=UPI00247A190D|nr:uncharacterized protein LOC129776015 [Toxorhynchites rutilus septentrionalis]
MKSFVIFVAILGFTAAQRDTSLAVIDSLREVQPAYRDLQNFVINAVSSAKVNSTQAIFDFHSDIFLAKDSFLRSAINLEQNTLHHVNGQNPEADSSCLGFLRSSVEVNLNLAGVSFTNCINTVDASLNTEIRLIYAELEKNESSFIDISIYDVFRSQNIFVDPQTIVDRLQEKLVQLEQTPNGLVAELSLLIEGFRTRLEAIRVKYRQCLTLNDQLLQTAYNTVLIQLQQICQGHLVTTTVAPPTDETTVYETPDSTGGPAEPPSVEPDESLRR